jgi:hypothetical protein
MIPFASTAAVSVAAFAVAGLILGLAYFAALWRTVALLVDRSPWLAPVALTLGRIGGAVLLLGGAVRFGAPDLIAAFVGIIIARLIAMRVVPRVA